MQWLRRLTQPWLVRARALGWPNAVIDSALWHATLAQHPFLQALNAQEQQALQALCHAFLAQKQFEGVGIEVTDAMALAIAAQACLPLLHLDPKPQPHPNLQRALAWYDDFVGIVIYPGDMRARRQAQDDAGVVHHYSETLLGEAMDGGPIALSWAEVARAGDSSAQGTNLVIHEFAHKLDMRDGQADGCPPLPTNAARSAWARVLQAEYEKFCDAQQLAERFGAKAPFLDPYAAQSIDEFFAVACEAYFVNRSAFTGAHPALTVLFDSFFRPGF